MNKKAARLIGAQIPMHQKLGRYERYDPRPDIPYSESLPVMSLAEKIILGLAAAAFVYVLVFSSAPW